MKNRCLAALFALLLFVPVNAKAEISFNNESPGKSNLIYSRTTQSGFFDQLLLSRLVLNDGNEYQLTFSKTSPKDWYLFSDKGSTIQIDGEIAKLSLLDTQSEIKQGYSYANVTTTAMFDLTSLVDRLATAKSVGFRIYFDNQPPADVVVPDKVLREWQKVITMK